MQTFDVIVVGGGMVGISMALALDRFGFQTAVIDKNSLQPTQISINDPWQTRVSALNEASIKFLQYLSVWDRIITQRACPYTALSVWDGEATGEIEFDAQSLQKDHLGFIVENKTIRTALLQLLTGSAVNVLGNQQIIEYKLEGQGGQLVLQNGHSLYAPLLVAADGVDSTLRKLSAIASRQKDYEQHALVSTVETEFFHHHVARQVFMETGPLAFLPLQSLNGRYFCSIVWSLWPEKADRMQMLSDECFCYELQKGFENRAGKILWADKRLRYPLRQMHVRQYHRQGVVLVGDAAHSIHPLAGQGLNLGFMDVMVLAEELRKASERGDRYFAGHILDRYQRRRIGHNTLLRIAMSGFQVLFGCNDLRISWMRNTGMKLANRLPLVKQSIVNIASGMTADCPEFIC